MSHDAYKANLLRLRVSNYLKALQFERALIAAEEAIKYAAASLPANPLAGEEAIDSQALFDWAEGLEMRGIVFRHLKNITHSLKDFDDAEQAISMILLQFPMDENYSVLARILHNRSNARLEVPDSEGAGKDATHAIMIRRKLAARDPEEADLLAGTLKARSNIFLLVGEKAFALKDATEAVSIRHAALPSTPDSQQRHTFAMTVYTLAVVQEACGDAKEACKSVREAIGILTELLKQHSVMVVEQDLTTCKRLEARVC